MLHCVFALFFKKQPQNSLKFLFLECMVAAFLLQSCETVVDIDIEPHTPKLALQYNLQTDKNDQHLFIGRSQSVLSNDELWRNGRVPNATVSIKDGNGVLRQSFIYEGHPDDPNIGNYKPATSFTPVPGQSYTLTVSAPGFQTAQGTLTMPALVPVTTASFTPDSRSGEFVLSGLLRVQFNDLPNQQNFYRLHIKLLDQNGNQVGYFMQVREEGDIFGEEVEKIRLNHVFDDGWANNGQISFSGRVEAYVGSTEPKEMEVTLEHITRDLFLFERSRENYQEDNPFAEPLNLHSNLQNGYGNFGGITVTKQNIAL